LSLRQVNADTIRKNPAYICININITMHLRLPKKSPLHPISAALRSMMNRQIPLRTAFGFSALVSFMFCAPAHAVTSSYFSIIGEETAATGVNTSGLVVMVNTDVISSRKDANLWNQSTQSMTSLGALGNDVRINGITPSADRAVGLYQPGDHFIAFLWTASDNRLIELNTDANTASEATAINANGDVIVGYFHDKQNQPTHQPFRWTASDGMQALPTFGAHHASAQAINAVGDVIVGYAENSNNNIAVRWTVQDNNMISLGTLGGLSSYATAINAIGDVIVGHADDINNNFRAFLWTASDNTMRDLGTLGGGNTSHATAVNAAGNVVVG
jgi:probable HAF family extracellular repeat protein